MSKDRLVRAVGMLVAFFLINFAAWDLLVGHVGVPTHWASFIVYSVLFVIALLLFFPRLRQDAKALPGVIRSPKYFIMELVLFAIGGVLLSTLFVSLAALVSCSMTLPENQNNLNRMSEMLPMPLTFVMMVVYAPIIEELTFRHAIIGWPDERRRGWLHGMTVVSVIAFDLIHVMAVMDVFYYLGLSIALVTIYRRYRRNMWPSIFLHSLLNLGGFLLMLVGVL